jgi:hypothetical protein
MAFEFKPRLFEAKVKEKDHSKMTAQERYDHNRAAQEKSGKGQTKEVKRG